MGGNVRDYKTTFIGESVIFDTTYPFDITLETGVVITAGVRIITHYKNPARGCMDRGKVRLCKNVYLGMNVIICKPITIGENSIIGRVLWLPKIFLRMKYGLEYLHAL